MYYFIVNQGSGSGRGKQIWKTVEEIFESEGTEYRVYFTKERFDATKLSSEITSRSERLTLVVVGGDGTLNEAVNGIQDFSRITLAYIPTGSSNDFARALSLPSDPQEAVENILHPTYFKKVDIGVAETDGERHYFTVSCGCGFDAAVCYEAAGTSGIKIFLNHFHLGKLSYTGISLRQFLHSSSFPVSVTTAEGKTLRFSRALFVTAMNCNCEGGGIKMTPKARPDDGMLDIFVAEGRSRLFTALELPAIFLGIHTLFPGTHIYRTQSADIHVGRSLPVHTDGEPYFTEENIRVSCLPKALTLIAGSDGGRAKTKKK